MSKFVSFVVGILSGSAVGVATTLLLTPESGEDLRADARARWEEAVNQARLAKEQKEAEKWAQFEQMKRGG